MDFYVVIQPPTHGRLKFLFRVMTSRARQVIMSSLLEIQGLLVYNGLDLKLALPYTQSSDVAFRFNWFFLLPAFL